MSIVKIFYPNIQSKVSEARWMVAEGLRHNPRIQLVNSDKDAHYCINYKACANPSKRLIIIDYTDGYNAIHYHGPYLLYMKRSCVLKMNNNLEYIPRVMKKQIVPIAYAMKHGVEHIMQSDIVQDIDIACFFNMKCTRPIQHHHRSLIAKFINNLKTDPEFKNYNIHVGIHGACGAAGRNSLNDQYYNTISRSKIIVTCNPSMWSGDYRLFESFAGNALVCVDRMIMPVKHPFQHGKHLLYYHRNNTEQLKEMLLYYLKHEEERQLIAKEGKQYVLEHHRPMHRIDEMLAEIQHKEQYGVPKPIDKYALVQSKQFIGDNDTVTLVMPDSKTKKNARSQKQPHNHRARNITKHTRKHHNGTNPIGRQTNPIGIKTKPIGRQTNPISIKTKPIGRQTNPIGIHKHGTAKEFKPIRLGTKKGMTPIQEIMNRNYLGFL